MRLLIFIFLFSSLGHACECVVNLQGKPLFSGITSSENECYEKHVAPLMGPKAVELCPDNKTELALNWGCKEGGKNKPPITNFIDCKGAAPVAAAHLVNSLNAFPGVNKRVTGHLVDDSGTSCKPGTAPVGAAEPKPGETLGAEKIQLSFASEAELREALKKMVPGGILDRPLDGWEVNFAMPNDNGGLGALDGIFGNPGDDQQYTHGYRLSAAKGIGNGYHLTIEKSSDLYTQRVPGRRGRFDSQGVYHVDQYFLEENMLKLIVDNKDKGQATYFKAGGGWQNLNNEKAGGFLTSAAGQQRDWHNALIDVDPKLAPKYHNIGRGMDKDGIYVEGAVGVQGEKVLSDTVRVKGSAEVGAGASTISSDIAHVRGEVTGSVDYQPRGWDYATRVGVSSEVTKYNGSPAQLKNTAFWEIGSEKGAVGVAYTTRSTSQGPGYHQFDNGKESIMSIYGKYRWK
jgi:hypothetical protein